MTENQKFKKKKKLTLEASARGLPTSAASAPTQILIRSRHECPHVVCVQLSHPGLPTTPVSL